VVIHVAATKFKPFILSLLGFALFNIVNILIFMILNYFCLLTAYLCYVIINVCNLENHMDIMN
jgi:hypothetical protein